MESTNFKFKVTKYLAENSARQKVLERKEKKLVRKVIKAHKKLAQLHSLVHEHVGPHALDYLYADPFADCQAMATINTLPLDEQYEQLSSDLCYSGLDDETLHKMLRQIRAPAKQWVAVWEKCEYAQARLEELEERIEAQHKLLTLNCGRLWLFTHTHKVFTCF